MHQFEGYRVVDVDHIFDCGHQHVAPVAEQADAALTDRELLEEKLQTNVPEDFMRSFTSVLRVLLRWRWVNLFQLGQLGALIAVKN